MKRYGGYLEIFIFSKDGNIGAFLSLWMQVAHFLPSLCFEGAKCLETRSCNENEEDDATGIAIFRILSDS